MNHYEQIRQLDEKIAELPAGYISEKMIHVKSGTIASGARKGKLKVNTFGKKTWKKSAGRLRNGNTSNSRERS